MKKEHLQLAIITYIRDANGRRVKAREISEKFKIKERNAPQNKGDKANFRNTRQLVVKSRKIARENGILIGTSNRGYFLIKNEEDVQEHLSYIGSYIHSLQERLDYEAESIRRILKNEGILREMELLNP